MTYCVLSHGQLKSLGDGQAELTRTVSDWCCPVSLCAADRLRRAIVHRRRRAYRASAWWSLASVIGWDHGDIPARQRIWRHAHCLLWRHWARVATTSTHPQHRHRTQRQVLMWLPSFCVNRPRNSSKIATVVKVRSRFVYCYKPGVRNEGACYVTVTTRFGKNR